MMTGVDWRIILKWILRKQGGRVCTGFTWPSIGTIPVTDSSEHDNETTLLHGVNNNNKILTSYIEWES
jgi:hypothetical protein